MPPIHHAGEMAVWCEENWAAFETDLRRQRIAARKLRLGSQRRMRSKLSLASAWGVFVAAAAALLRTGASA